MKLQFYINSLHSYILSKVGTILCSKLFDNYIAYKIRYNYNNNKF